MINFYFSWVFYDKYQLYVLLKNQGVYDKKWLKNWDWLLAYFLVITVFMIL